VLAWAGHELYEERPHHHSTVPLSRQNGLNVGREESVDPSRPEEGLRAGTSCRRIERRTSMLRRSGLGIRDVKGRTGHGRSHIGVP
jgi:hypothetical protein